MRRLRCETLAGRHAEYFLSLVEAAEAGLAGADWRTWRQLLHAERENLRAALDWAVAWGEHDIALRLVGSLWRWFRPDAIAEGRRWIEQALALAGGAEQARAKAFFAFGVVAMQQGEYPLAAGAWKECISIWRALGDLRRLADTLMYLASRYRPDARAVSVLLEESIALARQVGDTRRLALALGFLGWQVLQSVGPDVARPAGVVVVAEPQNPTVRRYLATPEVPRKRPPEYSRAGGLTSPMLQPFLAYLQGRWQAGPNLPGSEFVVDRADEAVGGGAATGDGRCAARDGSVVIGGWFGGQDVLERFSLVD
jgi:hypothetical protein